MVNRNIKFTVKDYMSIQDDKRYELIEGELVMVPSPSVNHQQILMDLAFFLREFVRRKDLGRILIAPMDVVLSDHDVLQPDILFISKDRRYIIAPGNIRGAPDLVVEILSPSTEQRDRTVKSTIYARHGVREYWLVSLEEPSVEVLSLEADGYMRAGIYKVEDSINSPLLQGLSLPVKSLFTPA